MDQATADKRHSRVMAFLDHLEMERIADYVTRGRRFAFMDAERLREGWVSTFKECVTDPTEAAVRDWRDFDAELGLRALPLPWHEVEREQEQLKFEIGARQEEIEEVMYADAKRFLEQQLQPN